MTQKPLFKYILNLVVLTLFYVPSSVFAEQGPSKQQPNIVVIFVDDMGYGDMGSYGHPTIHTPNLDQMAAEGAKWTNFYAPANVCSPSRAGLLTGRLPIRTGMFGDTERYRVLFPNSGGGLPANEQTIAEMLKEKGYKTAAIGKWHLGHLPQFLPISHGFDYYYGIPYSNDMNPVETELSWIENFFEDPHIGKWHVPLMRDEKIIERPADQRTITKRYTEEAMRFIAENKDEPFFVYLAHSMPHVPLFATDAFLGTSDAGLYGDVIEEIDWSVGQVLSTLKKNNIDDNTLVVFTSDNGPWLVFRHYGGSSGPLHDGKGTTWEGGMRVPGIFHWPGKIKPSVVHEIGSSLDLLPTIAALTDGNMPGDRVYDSVDLSPVLLDGKESARKTVFYYRREELMAVRHGDYKAHFITEYSYRDDNEYTVHETPLLFNLMLDPSEKYNIAAENPEIVAMIEEIAREHKASLEPVEVQFNILLDEDF